jgi:hypothetical protein
MDDLDGDPLSECCGADVTWKKDVDGEDNSSFCDQCGQPCDLESDND